MDHASSSALVFEKAQQAFNAGDYSTAKTHMEEVESLVAHSVCIRDSESRSNPTYSIILVTYGSRSGFAEALRHLVKYSDLPEFELITVNNGSATAREVISGLFNRFRCIEVGFNYGCSGARNLGARAAKGEFIIFLEDDGFIQEGAVESLIEAVKTYDAVVVRGRYLRKTEFGLVAPHYDIGDEVTYSFPNTEGISIWRRDVFLEKGGFDPLLSGWEGIALGSKVYKFHGPESLLYTPRAILFHDFAQNSQQMKHKLAKRLKDRDYLAYAYPTALETKKTLDQSRKSYCARLSLIRSQCALNELAPGKNKEFVLSVVTVARDATNFVDEYTHALKSQTHHGFEVIFVDEESNDDTVKKVSRLWNGDDRLRLIRGPRNRAAALNLAISHANCDICVIADIADISNPKRLELTLRHLHSNQDEACVGFATFDESRIFEGAGTETAFNLGMRTRSLLGLPTAFSALGFRKSRFTIPFDQSLSYGFAHKWLCENLRYNRIDGIVVAVNQVFSRSDRDKDQDGKPRELELNSLYLAHQEVLGDLSEKDRTCIRYLSGWENPTEAEGLSDVQHYVTRLIAKNSECQVYGHRQIEQCLLHRLLQLELSVECGRLKKKSRKERDHLRMLVEKHKQAYKSERMAFKKYKKMVLARQKAGSSTSAVQLRSTAALLTRPVREFLARLRGLPGLLGKPGSRKGD
jgi:glycosyltransferase involved in cell wall biosynthesis